MEQEAYIWQRVNAPAPAQTELSEAMNLAALSAAAFRDLAKSASGQEKKQLSDLMDREMHNIHAIRGILHCTGRTAPQVQLPASDRGGRSRILCQCIQRCRQEHREYASRLADPDFGPVYQMLANREAEQLSEMLALLGKNV